MRAEIIEAATHINNSYVNEWKNSGRKIVGFPCTFVPEEILYAAGLLPFRLRGNEAQSTTFADIYFGHVICSYPKCILEMVGDKKYDFLDGAIVSNGCDAGRRLEECWRKAGNDHDGILPPFFYYFSSPHKVSDYSKNWFGLEIRRLVKSLEDHFDVTITDDKLMDSIKIYNKSRLLLKRIDKFRIGDEVMISGTDAQTIILAGSSIHRKEYNNILEETLDELENDQKAGKEGIKGKRLFLAGSIVDDVKFIKTIEDEGAVIVSDNQCFGTRSYVDMVDENMDPLDALVKRYLERTFCPRMFGYYKDRFKYVIELVKEAKIDGVILQNILFCDLHGADNGLFQKDLEREGIPSIVIEREYGPLSEEGRIRMRVDSFLESLG
jgi:benzoyl-CoA reductase subunit C